MKKYFLTALFLSAFSIESYSACQHSSTINTPTTRLAGNNARTALMWLSNTSNHTVYVTIKVYDDNGNDVTYAVVTGSNTMSLNTKGSGYFHIKGNGADRTTYSELTWTSSECLTTPMIGNIETLYQAGDGRYGSMANPINSGQPF